MLISEHPEVGVKTTNCLGLGTTEWARITGRAGQRGRGPDCTGYWKDCKVLALSLRWSSVKERQVKREGGECFLSAPNMPGTHSAPPQKDAEVGSVFWQRGWAQRRLLPSSEIGIYQLFWHDSPTCCWHLIRCPLRHRFLKMRWQNKVLLFVDHQSLLKAYRNRCLVAIRRCYIPWSAWHSYHPLPLEGDNNIYKEGNPKKEHSCIHRDHWFNESQKYRSSE